MDCWSKLIGGKKLVKDEPFGEEGGDHLAWNSRQRKHSLPTGVLVGLTWAVRSWKSDWGSAEAACAC